MKYAYLENNIVVDIARVPPENIFYPEYAAQFIECADEIDHNWTYDGVTWSAPMIPPKTQYELEQEVKQSLNLFAMQKGYDNIETLCSYANSTNETWKAEALTGIALRDSTWDAFYNSLPLPVLTWEN